MILQRRTAIKQQSLSHLRGLIEQERDNSRKTRTMTKTSVPKRRLRSRPPRSGLETPRDQDQDRGTAALRQQQQQLPPPRQTASSSRRDHAGGCCPRATRSADGIAHLSPCSRSVAMATRSRCHVTTHSAPSGVQRACRLTDSSSAAAGALNRR